MRTFNSALDPTARGASGVHFERRVAAPRAAGHRERYPQQGGYSVKGIQFVVDGSGRKTAVQIDLKKQGRLWEDFYDRALTKRRAAEPRESLASVKKRVLGLRQRRRRG